MKPDNNINRALKHETEVILTGSAVGGRKGLNDQFSPPLAESQQFGLVDFLPRGTNPAMDGCINFYDRVDKSYKLNSVMLCLVLGPGGQKLLTSPNPEPGIKLL